MTTHTEHHLITPRKRLDFGLSGDIPKYWFDGDPFKSRFFDALSVIFPPGERFFMSCVRDFRDRVDDPQLLEDIKNFNLQEGQHTMVHNQFNTRLRDQGVDLDGLNKFLEWLLFGFWRKYGSSRYTLAQTAALEHFTAIGAFMMFGRGDFFDKADPRIRAMYAWHAIEEVEHKGVAYDVMQKYAKVGYFMRVLALIDVSISFPATIFYCLRQMLVADGYTLGQRIKLFAKGTWWLVKPGGLMAPLVMPYLRYFKPGYHPWDEGTIPGYDVWLAEFSRSGNPVLAGNAIMASHGAAAAAGA
jgi:predicted metal-dependent hydrolase